MKNGFVHINFILRQIMRSRRQATVFVLCVALSIVTLISLNGFSASVQSSMQKDAKTLHAADIIIRSQQDLSPAVLEVVERLENTKKITSTRIWEFYSMVRRQGDTESLLAKLKVVEPGYPFYGRVVLKSGRSIGRVLKKGRIIVAQALLDRLKLNVGDQLRVGNEILTISDVVHAEPDQQVNFFFLGPRVFVASEDLKGLDLVKKGRLERDLRMENLYLDQRASLLIHQED